MRVWVNKYMLFIRWARRMSVSVPASVILNTSA